MVPDGTVPFIPFTGVPETKTPLQVVAVIAVIEETGLTVTVTVNTDPTQEPEVGVIW